jgi:hypothetical protein
VAVRVAVASTLSLPELAVTVAVVEFAATVTVAGTVNSGSLLERFTVMPPAGAALLKVTVQALEALEPTVVGLHTKEETVTATVRFTVAVAELVL